MKHSQNSQDSAQPALFDFEGQSTSQDALGFLIDFAKYYRGEPFNSEMVTQAAADVGIVFADARAWGAVFITAAKEGYIRRSEVLFARNFGNGTLAPGWIGV